MTPAAACLAWGTDYNAVEAIHRRADRITHYVARRDPATGFECAFELRDAGRTVCVRVHLSPKLQAGRPTRVSCSDPFAAKPSVLAA